MTNNGPQYNVEKGHPEKGGQPANVEDDAQGQGNTNATTGTGESFDDVNRKDAD
jgi:hypothetical protein